MHRRRNVGIAAALAIPLLVLAGCEPQLQLDSDGRTSEIDALDVDVVVRPDGSLRVTEKVEFAGDGGGTVELPAAIVGQTIGGSGPDVTFPEITLPPGITLPLGITLPDFSGSPGGGGVVVTEGVSALRVDGTEITPEPGTFGNPQLEIDGTTATIKFNLTGAVDRYQDIAILDLDVLPSPDDSSRQDPDVDLVGTVSFETEAPPGDIDAHLYAGRNRSVRVDGSIVAFSSDAPIWTDGELFVGFDPARVPGVEQISFAQRDAFAQSQQTREQIADSTESTLDAVDTETTIATWILGGVAFLLPAIFWVIVAFQFMRAARGKTRDVGPVPDELSDPPTAHDPAVVAALWGEGTPEKSAVAGTMLALAQRKALTIEEYGAGERIVVKIPLAEVGSNPNENIVLTALRESATPEGVIEGPPVWRGSTRWWRSYRGAAIRRARSAGFVKRRLPLASLSAALVSTAIGVGIWFFSRPVVYVAMVIVAQIIGTAISLFGGWTLTPQGQRSRALWGAFKRYVHNHGELTDVGPSGIVMWGPYLAYGVVLGEAKDAARPLTP